MRKKWLMLCIALLLLIGLLPVGCSCNCSTDDSGVGGGWRPEDIGRHSGSIAFIAQRDGYSDIYVAEADGSNRERLTNSDTDKRELSWSPDGSKIIFTTQTGDSPAYDREVYIMSSYGTNLVSLGSGSHVNWSPDGKKILYTQDYDFYTITPDGDMGLNTRYPHSLYSMNPDGTDKKELVRGGDSWALGTVWSPDGSKIAYRWRLSGSRSEVWVMNADGSGQIRVAAIPHTYGVSSFVWSPDGKKLTYTIFDNFAMWSSDLSYEPGPTKIYTVNADGSDLAEVYNFPSGSFNPPILSPDGDKVAYDSAGDIWVMDVDGTNQTKLTSGWGQEWSSDGTQIAYKYDDGF